MYLNKYLKRKYLTILFIFFFLVHLTPTSLLAFDVSDFVQRSDRRHNSVIIEYIKNGTLESTVTILSALSRRKDNYIENIIENILTMYTTDKNHIMEYLLRVLIFSFFHPLLPPEILSDRVSENKEAILSMLSRQTDFIDPLLRASLLQIFSYMDFHEKNTVLLRNGELIIKNFITKSGRASPAEIFEADIFIEVTKGIGAPEFAEQYIMISELARNKELVEKARLEARNILKKNE